MANAGLTASAPTTEVLGTVSSVNVETNVMELSVTNGLFKQAITSRRLLKRTLLRCGYLSFDADGNNVNLERFPQSPV